MKTVKTILVVVGLLAILYGAYVVLTGSSWDWLGGEPPVAAEDPAADLAVNVEAPSLDIAGPTAPGVEALRPDAPLLPGVASPEPYAVEAPSNPTDATALGAPPSFTISDSDPTGGSPAAMAPPMQPPTDFPPANSSSSGIVGDANGRGGFFDAAWQAIEADLAAGDLVAASQKLTPLYLDDRIPAERREEVVQLLDGLAGTVVYAQDQHLLRPPHTVAAGETLGDIAAGENVPWELLARINNVADPNQLVPGEKLKIVPGPIRGVLRLGAGKQAELTLVAKGCCAARFAVMVENSALAQPGEYMIVRKHSADDPGNPHGGFALDLGGGLLLHDVAARVAPVLSVSSGDAVDLFYIFTERKSAISIIR